MHRRNTSSFVPTLFALSALFLALPAAAQNLLTNPGFDAGLGGWVVNEEPGVVDVDWRSEDATGDVGSGSARIEHNENSGSTEIGLLQCVEVQGTTEYSYGSRMRIPSGQSTTGLAITALSWYSDDACANFIGTPTAPAINQTGVWIQAVDSKVSPAGAGSAAILLAIDKDVVSDEDFQADFDDAFLFATSDGGGGECEAGFNTLCIDGTDVADRFRVQAQFQTIQGGGAAGQAAAVSLEPVGIDRGGILYFFNEDNPEILVKVLDGCGVNGFYWVFYAATTNVGFTIRVEDLEGDEVWLRTNPDLNPAAPVQDTEAFDCL